MKKYLFLMISILSIFIFTDNVNAYSYTYNNKEVDITTENFIYYLYNKNPEYFFDGTYNYYLAMYREETQKYVVYYSNPNFWLYKYNDNTFAMGYTNNGVKKYCYYTLDFEKESCTDLGSANIQNFNNANKIYFSNIDFSTSDYIGSTFSVVTEEDLKIFSTPTTHTISYYVNNELYQTVEVEEGSNHELLAYEYNDNTHIFSGLQYDEAIDLTNITSDITINATLEEKDVIPVYIEFPINKTEFYALLLLNAISIMMSFLKWCFPMKGGKNK